MKNFNKIKCQTLAHPKNANGKIKLDKIKNC